jgi:NADPH-dependent 2,4-dienoyl-CoA reductase/sulfur reductase-like enzyme/nitrite reductase/ring-hydroxylating ferredoxin subunit
MIQGKVGEDDVILVRRGAEYFAIGASCTHYGGPLVKGLVVGEEVRCPLHHACFSLRTGQVLQPPAFDPVPCWRTHVVDGRVYVRDKLPTPGKPAHVGPRGAASPPASVVIVGGGAAGFAAADALRREGYAGAVTILSADDSAPYDRPNLSKDYLAGQAQQEWMPLRPEAYYSDQDIKLRLRTRVIALDVARRQVQLDGGQSVAFDRLVLATGADPVRLSVPGVEDSRLSYLRTFADCRELIAKAASARQVLLIGGGFIGLEVAASLRERGVGVHVVAREREPLERVVGPEVGKFVRKLHEEHGVVFHASDAVVGVDGRHVTLKSGAAFEADLIVVGAGVRPAAALAEKAGLKVESGVVVDEYLQTSAPGIYAAGDIAAWPDPHSGERIRVEHWVVAERQGKAVARNILGYREPFTMVPFFWTRQFGLSIKYVGHAQSWDSVEIDGSLDTKSWLVRLKRAGQVLAVVSAAQDLESLKAEAALQRL